MTIASMTILPKQARRRPHKRGIVLHLTCALLALWAAASGYYIVFHDSLLADLLSRQAEMQYAYEDKIAELRGALDVASARTRHEGQAQESALRDLAALGARLEARTDSLAGIDGTSRPVDLRLHAASDEGRHAALDADEVMARFAALDVRQGAIIEALRDKTEHANIRSRAALSELGLAPPIEPGAAAGGPFVPLTAERLTPEDNLAFLKEALVRRRQLEAVTAKLPLRQPVGGRLDVTSGFGARRDPFYGRLALHTGIDLRADYGGAVRAVAAGTVTIAGPANGYGTLVEIDHGNGYATRYAHLSTAAVTIGQKIGAGDAIGQVGTSGRSTGPHLHYEIRIAGEPVDPARYLELATAIAGD